ncbi:MAG: FAD-dependent oxidoreductase, partial [Bacteroidales bacterium]|nr:FAD-dependent oxidoreductase [Bacteroidales bacterium]
PDNPWPYWPNTLKTSSSHEEGCERRWSLATKKFIGKNRKVQKIEVVKVEWEKGTEGKMKMKEISGSNEIIEADLVLLSMGFAHAVHEGLVNELNLDLDVRGNIRTNNNNQTSNSKVFAAGDAVSGASLVVKAIFNGRETAQHINEYLK